MVRAISLCLTDSTCGSGCWAAAVGYVPWHCHGLVAMACHGYDEIQLRLQPMQSEWPWNGTLDGCASPTSDSYVLLLQLFEWKVPIYIFKYIPRKWSHEKEIKQRPGKLSFWILVFTSILRSILSLQSSAKKLKPPGSCRKACVVPRRDGPYKLWIYGMWLHGLRELLGTLEWWGKLSLAVPWMRVEALHPKLSLALRPAEVGRGWDVDWTWRGGLWRLLSLQEWWWKGSQIYRPMVSFSLYDMHYKLILTIQITLHHFRASDRIARACVWKCADQTTFIIVLLLEQLMPNVMPFALVMAERTARFLHRAGGFSFPALCRKKPPQRAATVQEAGWKIVSWMVQVKAM